MGQRSNAPAYFAKAAAGIQTAAALAEKYFQYCFPFKSVTICFMWFPLMTKQDVKHDLVLQRFYSKNNKIKKFYVHVVCCCWVFFFF